MRFNSMAVSVLAQSVPLLAVGHLAGWKRREERSWLQSRRLRDALLVGDHDKKGMLFEKRIGVYDKHDDVLEKKRSGSARLVQDSASREIPYDDREASVECNPLSKVTDSGIFGCGLDRHCVESEESKMGGLCVAASMAPSINRALQENDFYCDEGTDETGTTCDCSQFNQTSGVGNATCTGPFCVGMYCGNFTSRASSYADGSFQYESCYELSGNTTAMGLESYCYSNSFSSDLNSTECEIKGNGVACNSCEYGQVTCPAGNYFDLGTVFDCTNTVMNIEGNTCDAPVIYLFAGVEFLPETDMPATPEMDMPATPNTDMPATPDTGPPSATPMPTKATSSGRSHTAKVPIIVSAAAAAWMASFGT
jgi:hypothetical protein